jgi:hypothetical protein
MPRAIRLAAVALGLVALLPTQPRATQQKVELVNGIGLIDYARKPHFKVGDWVQYHVTGSSEMGMHDDYDVTVLIGGEEKFWGEDCFWVETWTAPATGGGRSVATLMSYAIFDDSLPIPHLQLYARKMISEMTEDGHPIQSVMKRPTGSLTSRKPIGERVSMKVDTVGSDTVAVPPGLFQCKKVSIQQGIATTMDVADSSIRTEVRENRLVYMTPEIPITAVAREDIEYSIMRKTWKIGRSEEGPLRTMDRSTGSARLTARGENGHPQLVPEYARKALASSGSKEAPRPGPPKARAVKRRTG